MTLVYLTGVSGVGKTAVGEELRRRGYGVYDVDVDGLARWFENASGVEVPMAADRGDSWYGGHTYRLPPDTVRRLTPGAGITFITGTVGNEDEVWDLFSKVVHLTVDGATLKRRLLQRAGFGSTPDELERVLGWQARADADNARYGARLVDATAPVHEVADRVLEALRP